jgi:hypothetical protein
MCTFNGLIDDVIIFDRELTTVEINQISNLLPAQQTVKNISNKIIVTHSNANYFDIALNFNLES